MHLSSLVCRFDLIWVFYLKAKLSFKRGLSMKVFIQKISMGDENSENKRFFQKNL
jgi:hypothetical protein